MLAEFFGYLFCAEKAYDGMGKIVIEVLDAGAIIGCNHFAAAVALVGEIVDSCSIQGIVCRVLMSFVEGFGKEHAVQSPVAVGAEGGGVYAVDEGHCRVGVLVDYGFDVL